MCRADKEDSVDIVVCTARATFDLVVFHVLLLLGVCARDPGMLRKQHDQACVCSISAVAASHRVC